MQDLPPQSETRVRDYRGLWIALENCRYDLMSGKPTEGNVVDSDVEFASLCARMKSSGRCSCAIVFCDESLHFEANPAYAVS